MRWAQLKLGVDRQEMRDVKQPFAAEEKSERREVILGREDDPDPEMACLWPHPQQMFKVGP